jgi:hypothetical protein
MLRFFAGLLGLGIVCSAVGADLAVTRVALYKHGVAFFERAGDLAAGESARLEFKASEMDDVLKSLTIRQEGGDGVSAIQYDSADPLEKRLENFSFRVGESASLASVLDQFKGARIAIEADGNAAEGLIVSARSYPAEQGAESQELLLATEGGGLQTFDPRRARVLRFLDEELQRRFLSYLGVVAQSRNAERRGLTIRSSGGSSRIAAAYLAPAPIWKSSYRLILSDDDKAKLEGWAIIDNTSTDDWTNVELSLVSGLPVSFVSSLYAPQRVARHRVELQQDRASRPILHGAAVDILPPSVAGPASREGLVGATGVIHGTVMDSSGGVIPMAMIRASGPGPETFSATSRADGDFRLAGLPYGTYSVTVDSAGFKQYRTRVEVGPRMVMLSALLELGSVTETTTVRLMTESAVMSGASSGSTVQENLFSGEELGDLFEYSISEPVTVAAGQSAMMPFFSGEIDARRILIYNEDYGSQHPLHAVELTNDGAGALDGGAITVYDRGGYGGEGMMETVKPGDKRLVSYAVDLGTRITSAFRSDSKTLSELHARNGLLLTKTLNRERKTFTIRNVDERPKTLWIEHEVEPGFEPVGLQPTEKTADAWRFEAELEPGATSEVELIFEQVEDNQIYLSNMQAERLRYYVNNPDYDETARRKLEEIAKRLDAYAALEAREMQLEDELDKVEEAQDRLRQNIATLNAIAGQGERVQQMADQLSANEERIGALEAEIKAVEAQLEASDEEIEQALEMLAF